MNIVQSCSICNYIVGYQVTTAVELGNQTGNVLQIDSEGQAGSTGKFQVNLEGNFIHSSLESIFNVSTTSHFVACSLDATTTPLDLFMQDGRITNTESLPSNSKEAGPWTTWPSGNITELGQELGQMACILLSGLYID